MITPENGAQYITNRYWRPKTFYGLSTDTKPTDNIVNGSVFIEMDTSTMYFFDQENAEWHEWGAGSGT